MDLISHLFVVMKNCVYLDLQAFYLISYLLAILHEHLILTTYFSMIIQVYCLLRYLHCFEII